MLAVTDTGCGMDPETQRHIFEPFFTTKGSATGTGLGLSTVYGMVKQLGGDIWVYSEPGKGSTFKLYFPRTTDREAAAGAEGEVPETARFGETILIVENEPALRSLTQKIVEQLGYTVLTAAGPSEALALHAAHSGPIALLLTDMALPEMSGRQLAEVMLAARPGMQVVYLSGFTEGSVAQQGILDPTAVFVPKPFTRGALARTIRSVLGG
jgi:CheY-like chemotaxis protein